MHAGVERHRKQLLKTAAIVGVTCCSALLSALDKLEGNFIVMLVCARGHMLCMKWWKRVHGIQMFVMGSC